MEIYIANFIGNLFELLILNIFMSSCCSRKFSPVKHYLLNIPVLIILFTGTNLFIGKSVFIIIASITSNFVMTLLYKCKWHMRLLYSFSVWLIIALTEILMMVFFNMYGINAQLSQDNPKFFILGTVVSKIFALIIACILRLFIKRKQYTIKNVLLVSPLPLSSAVVLVVLFPLYYTATEVITFAGIFVAAALLIIANMSVFYFLEKQDDYITSKAKLMFAENQITAQKEHYMELYSHLNEIRTFRHDIKNMMLSLMGLINEGETEKALKAIQNTLDVFDIQSKNTVNCGNPVIDAVIYAKHQDAQSKNIQLASSLKLPYDIKADEIEFGILLGNILDNAIEATEKVSEEKRIPITLSIISTQGHISVNTTNCTCENTDTASLQTTKKDTENHGYGTKIIKAIAEKYNGFADFESKDNIFTTRVNICNEKV